MEYTIILESAASFKPNWEKATSQLSAKVNAAIGAGWRPLGGVCFVEIGYVLMQTMTRDYVTVTHVKP